MKNKLFANGIVIIFGILIAASFNYTAYAFPNLQLYIDADDTAYWGTDPANPWHNESWHTSLGTFDLWIIAAEKDVNNVKLVIAVPPGQDGSITLTQGSDIFTYYSFSDFVYGTPIIGTKPNGDPKYLAPHGVYDTDYALHNVGDIVLNDDDVYNMVDDPDHTDPKKGTIIKYNVQISGFNKIHFDAFGDGGVFAPFSHDAQVAPEPATIALLGLGLLGFGLSRRGRGN